jgi:hypothetical protein
MSQPEDATEMREELYSQLKGSVEPYHFLRGVYL